MSALPRSDALLEVLDTTRTLRAEVATLCEQVAALRGEVAELRIRAPSVAQTRDGDTALLRLILDATGGRRFAAFELVDHAPLAGAEALRAALGVAVGADLKVRRVGKLLERLERLDAGGVVLRRVERDRLGIVWRAVQVV